MLEVFSFRDPEKPYTVHAGLIYREADEVASKLEENDNIIQLEPRVLCMFLVWLYLGRICRPESDLPGAIWHMVHRGPHHRLEILHDNELADLFIFARQNGLRKLKNDIMTQLILQHEKTDTALAENAEMAVLGALGMKNKFYEFALIAQARYMWNMTADMAEMLERRHEHRLALRLDMSSTHDTTECKCAQLARADPEKRIFYFHEHHSLCETITCKRKLRALGAPDQASHYE